jgi:hypothetical protein
MTPNGSRLCALAASSSLIVALVTCSNGDTPTVTEPSPAEPPADEAPPANPESRDRPPYVPRVPTPTVPPGPPEFKPDTFNVAIGNAVCNALTRCCFNDNDVAEGEPVNGAAGSGKFNREKCVNTYSNLGFEGSHAGILAIDRTNVQVNQAKTAACIAKINTLACNLDGAALKDIRATCFDALEGQLVNNDPCKHSVECKKGLFCLQRKGEATGTCVPLRTEGQTCGDVVNTGDDPSDSLAAEVACSSRGGGDTGLMCESYVWEYKTDRSQWLCKPARANGLVCNTSVSCASGICDPGDNLDKYICEPTLAYFTKPACKAFITP